MMSESTEKNAHLWARDPLDWYVEDERVTRQLAAVEMFTGPILDPCCGGGNVVKALLGLGHDAAGMDIVDRTGGAPWFAGMRDFLSFKIPSERLRRGLANIVSNPPYFGGKGTEAFIRAALPQVTGKLCVFVDRRFLTGRGRASGLYREHRPSRVWEITPRPSCPPGAWLEAGNKAGGGTADYCWLVWDKAAEPGRTNLGWLYPGMETPDIGDVI